MDYAQSKSAHRFGQVPLAIISDSRLTETDKTVYGALAAHRNAKHGKAWPKRSTVAKIVGIHVDSVSRSVSRLVECGYLVKTDGRGRGRSTVYTFPLANQRDAQRRASTPPCAPESPPKPRPERQKPVRPDSFCAASPIERTDVLEKEFTPLPPSLSTATVEPVGIVCGEIPTAYTPQEAQEAPSGANTTHYDESRLHGDPTRSLAYPIGLSVKIIATLARMLCGLPFGDAQIILDELAGNMRRHTIHNPCGYVRKLLELYRAGKLIPELADIEQERHRRQAENERSRQLAHERHLAALAQGEAPLPPPPADTGYRPPPPGALEQAKRAARGGLLSADERERLRAEYLASIGMGPKPAPTTPAPERGEGYAKFKAEMARIKAGTPTA